MPRKRSEGAVTLSDVAQLAGVSLATASRAINGSKDRSVAEELATRVREAAQMLGYEPDANAQAMARGATQTIGVAVNDLTDPYFAAIAGGMTDACLDRGMFLTLASTGNQLERLPDVVRSLDSLRVRAILLTGGRWRTSGIGDDLSEAIRRYISRGGRLVTVGVRLPGIDRVLIDNEGGSARLARALWECGYRRPIVLTGPEMHSTATVRAQAFLARARELGCRIPPENQIVSDYTRAGGQEAMRLALESGLKGDIVVATNDVMALGAMSQARQAGVAAGTELGFAGFGDIAGLEDAVPTLTTVRVPKEEMGRQSVALAVTGPGDGTGEINLPTTVVLRDSTPRRTGRPA